jgi:small subunit ribosomal protein S8
MDPIADLINRIKNAGHAHKESVSVPFSKMKFAIAELLSKKGMVGSVVRKGKGEIPRYVNIEILYGDDGRPKISDVKRISKPSRRLYEKSKNIRKFKGGFGMTALSTPKGILSGEDARKEKLGGEVLFNIW